jgi:hypothetical protein
MGSPPRRTLSDLEARYSLHPDLRDFYLEGYRDVARLRWVLSELGLESVGLYPVGSIDIPDSVLTERGLDVGEQGRIFFLTEELSARLALDQQVASFIADRDLFSDPPPNIRLPCFSFTDYAAFESYAAHPLVLDRYVKAFLAQETLTGQGILDQLDVPLRQMFGVRKARKQIGINIQHLPFTSCCSLSGRAAVQFDMPRYVEKQLFKGPKGSIRLREQYVSQADVAFRGTSSSPTFYHGHDFIQLLSWYQVNLRVSRELCDPVIVERAIMSQIPLSIWEESALVKWIRERAEA